MKNFAYCLAALLVFSIPAITSRGDDKKQETAKYEEPRGIYYHSTPIDTADAYMKEKCTLDIHYPVNRKNVPVVIWIHGGGLRGGKKVVPNSFRKKEMTIVGIDYRVSPKVKCPVYIQDVAEAINWVFKNIAKYNGDTKRIYLSGHSAGGYLAALVGMDPRWLAPYNIKPTDFRAICPMSGMMTTHFTIKEELTGRKEDSRKLWIDDYAPLRYASKDLPPILLMTGGREMDWPGRWEANLLMQRLLKGFGHKDVTLFEINGYGHSMTHPGVPALEHWIKKREADAAKTDK